MLVSLLMLTFAENQNLCYCIERVGSLLLTKGNNFEVAVPHFNMKLSITRTFSEAGKYTGFYQIIYLSSKTVIGSRRSNSVRRLGYGLNGPLFESR